MLQRRTQAAASRQLAERAREPDALPFILTRGQAAASRGMWPAFGSAVCARYIVGFGEGTTRPSLNAAERYAGETFVQTAFWWELLQNIAQDYPAQSNIFQLR